MFTGTRKRRRYLYRLSGPQGGVIVGAFLHLCVIAIGAVGFTWIEGWSFLDSFFMTVITISTVGYSEIHPLSPAGRQFTIFLIVGGLATIFFTTTMLGRVILEGEFRGTIRRKHMKHKITKLRGHYIVCGFGRVGRIVADELYEDKHPFVVVENDPARREHLEEAGYFHIIGDATEESVLGQAGIQRARSVLALLSSDADNLYITMMAKDINPRIQIVARALDEMAERRIKRGGADSVVATYKIAAMRVLQAAVNPTVSEFFDLVSDRETLSLTMEEVTIHSDSYLINRSLGDAAVRANYGVIVVAIKKPSGEMVFNPVASVVLAEKDILIALGEDEGLKKLVTECRQPAPTTPADTGG
jgi:voltage-gated potassium channel